MTDPAFTVLLPVHRPPAMLPYAIASVQAQQRRDFELLVICDGAPPETAELARSHAANDPRIQVFEHAKGERHGEAYRDQALQHARGRFICQIGDDDLWLPIHLEEMSRLLTHCDFGNLPQVQVAPDGTMQILPGNLADAAVRQSMLTERFNFFGPTVAGYRIEAYRALPVGWSPAPPDIPTDLFMWQKFLVQDGLRFGSRLAITSLKFVAAAREEWPLEERGREVATWSTRLSNEADRDQIVQSALSCFGQLAMRSKALDKKVRASTARISALESQLRQTDAKLATATHQSGQLSRKLEKMRRSWSWRLMRPFRKLARRIGGTAAR